MIDDGDHDDDKVCLSKGNYLFLLDCALSFYFPFVSP